MKFAHISDLHLGKKVHQFSMIEEQKYILEEIAEIVFREEVDGILIAGDVYDKIYPSAEAVALFDSFLVKMAEKEIKVFVISGNHDSPQRIAFLGKLTKQAGVYLSPVYQGEVEKIRLQDAYGTVNVYLLPFIKPIHVRHFFPEETITNYTESMQVVIKHMNLEPEERNILLAHQFVTGARRSDSEEISVGGLDNVDGKVFEDFDYVALGHIHKPQKMGTEQIRYCGTPLKYSFSESSDKKSLTILELREKGTMEYKEIPLVPMHDMVKIKGTFADVMNPENFPGLDTASFLHVTLLDEQDVAEAFARLSSVYPNLMRMEYDNLRTREKKQLAIPEPEKKSGPVEMFSLLYETMNNQPLTERQKDYLTKKIEAIWKGEAK